MHTKPMIFPLDADGTLYSLQDETGNQVGVGSREVCQTLLYLITNSPLMRRPMRHHSPRAAEVMTRTAAAGRK